MGKSESPQRDSSRTTERGSKISSRRAFVKALKTENLEKSRGDGTEGHRKRPRRWSSVKLGKAQHAVWEWAPGLISYKQCRVKCGEGLSRAVPLARRVERALPCACNYLQMRLLHNRCQVCFRSHVSKTGNAFSRKGKYSPGAAEMDPPVKFFQFLVQVAVAPAHGNGCRFQSLVDAILLKLPVITPGEGG